MSRRVGLTVAIVALFIGTPHLAAPQSLGEVARKEKERRNKSTQDRSCPRVKIVTERELADYHVDDTSPTPMASATPPDGPPSPPALAPTASPTPPARGGSYWRNRKQTLKAAIEANEALIARLEMNPG